MNGTRNLESKKLSTTPSKDKLALAIRFALTLATFWGNQNGWRLQRGCEDFYGTIHGVNSCYDHFLLVRGNTPIRADGTNY